jgi:hypothetical protein
MWDVENIPEGDFVFMRVHKNNAPNGELLLAAFRDQGAGMSTDWEKYSTAEQTRNRAGRSKPSDNGVIKLSVTGIRRIEKLSVVHEPLTDNRAHTEVFGEKNERSRMLLNRLVEWAIKP